MGNRRVDDWLQSYLEYTQNQESPEKLHLWTAFALLSAALKRQVWMDRGYYKLFTNVYILIVAESARARKSSALNIGLNMLRKAVPDIYYITGTMTPEGLTKLMNRVKTIVKDGKHNVMYDSHVLIHADELASLFGYDRQRASRLTMLLTEGYGCPDEYMHTTSGEGQLLLRNMYPTILAATDPRNLKVLPEEAVAGLIGRLIFVTARGKRRPIAWPTPTDSERALWESLREDLYSISLLRGAVTVTREAHDLFESWYNKRAEVEVGDPRLDAFNERCHDTVLKIAMLLSIAKNDDLIVNYAHMMGGIEIIQQQLPEFVRVSHWAATTVFAQNKARLIDMMRRAGGVGTRKAALKLLQISVEDLLGLEAALEQEGTMTVTVIRKEIMYKLSREMLLAEGLQEPPPD